MFNFFKGIFKSNKNINNNSNSNLNLRQIIEIENSNENNEYNLSSRTITNTVNIETKTDDMICERNLKGIELEKQGKIDEAIELYELNVKAGIDGNHPYDRLAIIYRKRKQYDDEIRVLEKAVKVYSKIKVKARQEEISKKLNRFQERLIKVKELYKLQESLSEISNKVK